MVDDKSPYYINRFHGPHQKDGSSCGVILFAVACLLSNDLHIGRVRNTRYKIQVGKFKNVKRLSYIWYMIYDIMINALLPNQLID